MPEHAGIDGKLQEVEDQVEQLRERLTHLSSAIWQSIDHDNPAHLETGVRFKQAYNEQRGVLEAAMEQLLAFLREYPSSNLGAGVAEPGGEAVETAPEGPAVPGADGPAAAGLPDTSGLDQKVPFGFVLGGQTYTSASAWPLFYEALLQELYSRAPEQLTRLVDAPDGLAVEGKRLFARVPDPLDDPLPIADAIFAEADLAPQSMLQAVKYLVSSLDYSLESFKILLKEKNRGTVETMSLAN